MKFVRNSNSYTRLLETLCEAIHSNKWDKVTAKSAGSKTILGTNWRRIPNAAAFSIHPGRYSKIWQEILGVLRRTSTQVHFLKAGNRGMNRYIEHQLLRLRKLKSNPLAYFRIARWLAINSKSFRVSAIHHVFPLWYRNMKIQQVKSINTKCTKLMKQWWVEDLSSPYPTEQQMSFKRHYIEKSTDEWRPLGVPQPQWRLFLHIFSNFLYMYLEDHFLPTQHGFIPGRGTMTAWKQFFQLKLYNYKYIYEIDLRKCFDKLNHYYIAKNLTALGVPKDVIYLIHRINKSNAKFPAWLKNDENDLSDTQNVLGKSPSITEIVSVPMYGDDGAIQSFKFHQFRKIGVAQGSNTGPLLTALSLRDFFAQCLSLSYADDALFFSNEPIHLVIPKGSGIELNEAKSGYVKYNGKWLKPFKFLGLQFDGRVLSARTRKGSTLVLSDQLSQASSAVENLESLSSPLMSPGNTLFKLEKALHEKWSWESLMKNKMGYIMSSLYNNTWNLKKQDQDFTLKFSKGTWTDIYVSKSFIRWEDITISNLPAFASESLFNIISGKSGVMNFSKYIEINKEEKITQKWVDKTAKAWEGRNRKKYFAIRNYYKRKLLGPSQ